MSAPLPVAVIGGGREGLRQAALIEADPRLKVAAVISPSEEGRERAESLGLPTAAELEDVAEHVAAAVVALPAASRVRASETCAARGLPLLLAGGLGASLRDSRRIIAAFAQAGAPLLVGHARRHHPAAAAAHEAAKGGLLGRLIAADAVWHLRKPTRSQAYPLRVQSGEGPVLDRLIHDVDLLRWLLGDAAEVTAMASGGGVSAGPCAAATLIRFEKGALATAILSESGLSPWGWEAATGEDDGIARSGEDCLRLVGTEGAMSLPSLTYWRHGGVGEHDRSAALTRLSLPCPPSDPLAAQMAHFARVASGAAAPLVTGEDALRSLALALSIEEAARRGAAMIPDPERPDIWEPTAAAIFRDLAGQRQPV
ncbi:Predicted dehydrogenase [Albimonas donghaensis]|uniref:Predicted dehydrogenase n=1 Tax=Albimonas donghaensis TaxID=356660 RepID=A0A1H2T383_9RHOB|nr:Gfo/Idh/MocA family oxidoreductase [Albimonas donghaensis]SDW38416.1 Predicted dehydrogenase [Albimonas donghaensis]